jgi:hypothetical protein
MQPKYCSRGFAGRTLRIYAIQVCHAAARAAPLSSFVISRSAIQKIINSQED